MKKYLNSVEEVVKALKEGKDVGDIETHDLYTMVDNVIYGYYNNGDIVVNDSVVFQKDRIYTEELEPLKFEVNRAYKTRDGNKVFLFRIESNEIPFLFVGEHGSSFWIFENGNFADNPLIEHKNDIVGYWED